MSNKSFNPAWLLAIFVPVIFAVSVYVYLTSNDDCYTTADGVKHCLTGFQTLKLEWPAFWTWAIIGGIVGLLCLVLIYFNESGSGAIGRKLNGNTGLSIALTIVALLAIAGPWGKGCTDKTNGGITAPGYQHVDSTQKN